MPSSATVSALVFSLTRSTEIADLALRAGLSILRANDVDQACNLLAQHQPDIVVLDHEPSAIQDLVRRARRENPSGHVIVLGSSSSKAPIGAITSVARVGEAGWNDLRTALELAGRQVELNEKTRSARYGADSKESFGHLVGASAKMQLIYRIIAKTAHHTYPVLILGESGTGKELAARSIHDAGPRAKGPFVPVDCSALAPSLIETELFGHVKGAFTGALASKQGLMASASGGTLFLDEIGNLPVDLQAKLLRAIQEKEVKPVGSNDRIRTDARIIAATNRDLEAAVRDGSFRQDLFFRLNVVQLRLPPLRDRRDDVELLAHHFLAKLSKEGARYHFSAEAMQRLKTYHWPGNVRELENAIERAMALSSGPVLHPADLPTNLQDFGQAAPVPTNEVLPMEELERRAIFRAIREAGGDKLAAARMLKIGKTTLYRKLREYEKSGKTGQD